MSSKFSGFSADEISKIHSKTKSERNANENAPKTVNNNNSNGKSKINIEINNKQMNNDVNQSETDVTATDIHDALYFKPLRMDTNQLDEIDLQSPTERQQDDNSTDEVLAKFRGVSLKKLEEHRQIMEEANKEKKKILSQTVEQLYVWLVLIITIILK